MSDFERQGRRPFLKESSYLDLKCEVPEVWGLKLVWRRLQSRFYGFRVKIKAFVGV